MRKSYRLQFLAGKVAPNPVVVKVRSVVLHPRGQGYDVEFEGEIIVKRTRSPERSAARALHDRGLTGPFQTTDMSGMVRMTYRSIALACGARKNRPQ